MNGSTTGVVVSLVIALAGPILVYLSQRRSTTTDAAANQINQIQEDRDSDRAEFAKVAARFDDRQQRLEKRIEHMESRERIGNDYILQLRYHIAEGHPPPPPPFPPELTRGMGNDR